MKNQRDQKWATWTGVLGFDVMGIWPDFADGTDVNAIDRTRSGRHVATADDFGGVKLFNYPCVVQDAPYVLGRGHSSHVMNVRFSPDDGTLISVGGKDRCVFQVRSPSHWFPYDRDRVVNADP
jgi:WD40 repeat protein